MIKLSKFKFKKLNKKQIMDLTYVIIILLLLGFFYYAYNKAEKYENFYQPLWVEAEKAKEVAATAIAKAKQAEAEAKAIVEELKRKEEEAKKSITVFGIKIPKLF